MQDRLILPTAQRLCGLPAARMSSTPKPPIDGGMIFGTGFAPFRAGPLHYARTRGLDEVVAKLEELSKSHGQRFRPDDGWKDLTST